MSERDDMKAAYQRERDWRIADESVVEYLEGALRRIGKLRCAETGGNSAKCPSCIARAALKAASLPSPEPTQRASDDPEPVATCAKCGEPIGPQRSPGIFHMCDPYKAAKFRPTQQEDG